MHSSLLLACAQAAAALLGEAANAYRRCTANREKCRRLLERMQLLEAPLRQLAEHLDAGEGGPVSAPCQPRVRPVSAPCQPHVRPVSAAEAAGVAP